MWPRIDGLRALELGLPGEQRQWLNDLVLRGEKKATAGRLAEYEAEGEELEQVGEQLVLVDDELQRLALVEVDRVEVVPFGTCRGNSRPPRTRAIRQSRSGAKGTAAIGARQTASTSPTRSQ